MFAATLPGPVETYVALITVTGALCFRQLLFSHRQTIAEQLRAETDGAMTLHLVAVLLFQVQTLLGTVFYCSAQKSVSSR